LPRRPILTSRRVVFDENAVVVFGFGENAVVVFVLGSGGAGVVVFVFVFDENVVGDFNGRDAWRDYAVFLAAT